MIYLVRYQPFISCSNARLQFQSPSAIPHPGTSLAMRCDPNSTKDIQVPYQLQKLIWVRSPLLLNHLDLKISVILCVDELMSQLDIYVLDLTVFQIPMSGRADLTDIRDGYIVSPGYPGRYPQEADGRLGITTSTAAVSSSHQAID